MCVFFVSQLNSLCKIFFVFNFFFYFCVFFSSSQNFFSGDFFTFHKTVEYIDLINKELSVSFIQQKKKMEEKISKIIIGNLKNDTKHKCPVQFFLFS